MKRFLSLLLISWFLIILQTTLLKLFSVGVVIPDLVFLTVLYLGLFHKFRRGSAITFFLGYLMDLFSGSPMGLYIFLYLGSFSITQLIREVVYFKSIPSQVIYVLILSFGNSLLLFLLLWIFSPSLSLPSSLLKWIIIQGVYNALVGPFLFLLLERINQRFLDNSLLEGI